VHSVKYLCTSQITFYDVGDQSAVARNLRDYVQLVSSGVMTISTAADDARASEHNNMYNCYNRLSRACTSNGLPCALELCTGLIFKARPAQFVSMKNWPNIGFLLKFILLNFHRVLKRRFLKMFS
jgi:hypothetical protein